MVLGIFVFGGKLRVGNSPFLGKPGSCSRIFVCPPKLHSITPTPLLRIFFVLDIHWTLQNITGKVASTETSADLELSTQRRWDGLILCIGLAGLWYLDVQVNTNLSVVVKVFCRCG